MPDEKELELRQSLTGQREFLIEQMHELLAPIHPLLLADVKEVLRGKGKLLTPIKEAHHAGIWPLLTFQVALIVNPRVDRLIAARVALALECLICALDLLDDAEDGDLSPTIQTLGASRALNVSTALLMLAQQALSSLPQLALKPALLLALLDGLREKTFVAIEGQHLDLLAEKLAMDEVNEEQCLEMAAAKSGALLSAACYLGALCGEAEMSICEQFAEIGKLAGISQQLENDCHDFYMSLNGVAQDGEDGASEFFKTDLQRSKKTLPIVLAYQFRGHTLADKPLTQMDAQFFQQGILTAWGIQLLYKDRIATCFNELEAIFPDTILLRMLLGVA